MDYDIKYSGREKECKRARSKRAREKKEGCGGAAKSVILSGCKFAANSMRRHGKQEHLNPVRHHPYAIHLSWSSLIIFFSGCVLSALTYKIYSTLPQDVLQLFHWHARYKCFVRRLYHIQVRRVVIVRRPKRLHTIYFSCTYGRFNTTKIIYDHLSQDSDVCYIKMMLLLLLAGTARGRRDGLAVTPPLGWSSWWVNCAVL